jgi:hypothetical protein
VVFVCYGNGFDFCHWIGIVCGMEQQKREKGFLKIQTVYSLGFNASQPPIYRQMP